MININKMVINNYLSYGENVVVNFGDSRVTQILGVNGSGKSSLHIILEELLFNKNSKKLAKKELKNRYATANYYGGSVEFDIGTDSYVLTKVVKTSAKVTLTKNGENISGHTATQTYKLLEDLMGIDFATFSKMVNQSLVSSLDFLALTDAKRKEFLVHFLGLEEYQEMGQKAKKELSNTQNTLSVLNNDVDTLESNLQSLHAELDEYGQYDKTPATIPPTPVRPSTEHLQQCIDEIRDKNRKLEEDYRTRLRDIDRINRANRAEIERADRVAEKLQTLKDNVEAAARDVPATVSEYSPNAFNVAKTYKDDVLRELKQINDKISELTAEAAYTHCSECGSELDTKHVEELLSKNVAKQKTLETTAGAAECEFLIQKGHKESHDYYNAMKAKYEKASAELAAAEDMADLEANLQDVPDTPDKPILECAKQYQDQISSIDAQYKAELLEYNQARELYEQLNNVEKRVASLTGKIQFTEESLEDKKKSAEARLGEVASLTVIAEALSGKGIINYKIASLMSSISKTINSYLGELSEGKYQIVFTVSDTKLGISLHYMGEEVSISSLSSGEYALVQVATLLGIRKTLAKISANKINLLFLDEVISVLDDDKKPLLIELLNKEADLTSLIVSHSYRHPFASAMFVDKVNNLSAIRYG